MLLTRGGASRLIYSVAAGAVLALIGPQLPSLRLGLEHKASIAPTVRPSHEAATDDLASPDAERAPSDNGPQPIFPPLALQKTSPLVTAYAPDEPWSVPSLLAIDPRASDPATLLGPDAEAFSTALAAYKVADFAAGDAAAARLQATLPITAAQWAGLRLHPREAGLARIARFMNDHPDWPAADWLWRRAEEALAGDKHSDAVVRAFFAQTKPVTAHGKVARARVFARAGDFVGASALVREAWREDEFNEALESIIKKEFGDLLTPADHKYRADRLLYSEKNGAALRAAELAGKDVVLLARARIAANNDAGSEQLFAKVPKEQQNDPGLLLARVHMLRKAEKIAEAGALLRNAPHEPERVIDGDAWWNERRLVARKLLDRGDATTAYSICAQHAARTTNAKVEAEFHAGWIALRFLRDPVKADRHFDLLTQIAETPIQKSRANYWRARALEARRTPEDDVEARRFYEAAAAHSTTFYGQMAREKLGVANSPLRPPPVAAEGSARAEVVRVAELYFAAGERELAGPLAAEAARRLRDEAQVAALGEVVARQRDAKISLAFGKLAGHRGVALDDVAFPSYGVPQFVTLPGSASPSVVYAIARQESAFDARAVSSAGAMGLMQMIPSTARRTAYQTRVVFDLARMLTEPSFNAQLGAAHLGILLGEHKGSYLLTFAAYNAGGGRVREWINAYGDPRRKDVDPIDWVERIPISETRNYVQRVMENYVVYRAKFGEVATPAPQMEMARAERGL